MEKQTYINFLAIIKRYYKPSALGVLLGIALGLSIAGPPVSQTQYEAHFLQKQIEVTPKAPKVVMQETQEIQEHQVIPLYPLIPMTPSVPIQFTKDSLLPSAPLVSQSDFPAFKNAIYPFAKAPNWGAMRTEADWNRIYPEMQSSDFVEIPVYNLKNLVRPLHELTQNLTKENIAIITEKLLYSTRFFGRYNIDSGEFEGKHPGIDFKLPAGTPVLAIAGGKVHAVGNDEFLGNNVMILHKLPTGEYVISIYGHLEMVRVKEGDIVQPGTQIGTVGSTGNSTGPHLHLQIDKQKSPGRHSVYAPDSSVSKEEAALWTLHPIEFIAKW